VSRIVQVSAQVSCDDREGGVEARILKKFTTLRQTLEQTNQDQTAYARLCGCANQVDVVFGGEAVED
jgi:hypothetical protein